MSVKILLFFSFPSHFKIGSGDGNKQESLSRIILGAEFCFNILRLDFFN